MQTWDSSLLIGVKAIDEQHKALFDEIHFLQGQISAGHGQHVVDGVLSFMDKYVAEHFEIEEALMESLDYPEIEAHRREHQRFIGKSLRFELDIHAGDANLPQNMLDFFTNWLIQHIGSSDKQLGAYINGNAR